MNRFWAIWRSLRVQTKRRFLVLALGFEGRVGTEYVPEERLRSRKRLLHYVYYLVFALLASFVLTLLGPKSSPLPYLRAGDIADYDIISPITADIQPQESPATANPDAGKRVAPIFDYDDSVLGVWLTNWKETFKKVREEFYDKKPPPGILLDLLSQRVRETTGQDLPAKDVLFLHQNRFSTQLESIFIKAAEPLLGRLIAPADLFPSYYSTGIVVRQLNMALNETLVHDVSRIWSVDHAREFVRQFPRQRKDPNFEKTRRMVEILANIIVPNLKFNAALTQKRIAGIVGNQAQTVLSVKRESIVVRRGERVTEGQAQLVADLRHLVSPASSMKRFVLTFLILFVFISILLRMEITKKGFWKLPLKDALFFMGITLLSLACVKLSLPFLKLFFKPFNLVFGVEYLLPISAGGIIIHLMMGKEAAYSFALLISISLGLLLDRSFYIALWSFSVISSAIQSIRSCKQRTDLYKSGAWSGAVGAMLVLAFFASQSLGLHQIDWGSMVLSVALAFVSGLLAAILTSAFIPVLEALFGYTTSLKLLELSNFNHPLLHSLMMKAPGTYHHSVIVGSLAEIAADKIKANALLARVSAYYHDIGKMSKPLYFIENQSAAHNPHDHLQPSMSAKILFSHVKHGVRLGRDHNLGQKIIDVIEQHHGTTLAAYFFNKAKRAENKEVETIQEADFRYPGPRPQSREAAIVMICDACEAATRSIAEPTPSKIQTMVHGIINRRLTEEQFNECDITLNDLQLIADAVTRTLVSLYHHRIEYPGQQASPPVPRPAPIPPPATPAENKRA